MILGRWYLHHLAEASRLDVLQSLWSGAGLVDVQTHVITVQRTYADFDDYWATIQFGPSVGKLLNLRQSRLLLCRRACGHACRLPQQMVLLHALHVLMQ